MLLVVSSIVRKRTQVSVTQVDHPLAEHRAAMPVRRVGGMW